MNKVLLSIVIVAIVAIALGTAGSVFAQSATPTNQTSETEYGYGMGGRGSRGGMTRGTGSMGRMGGNVAGTQDGLLHDEMIAAYAEKLGLSVEDLNARLEDGETMVLIADSQGITFDEFWTIKEEVRAQVVDQAVIDGILTQEQADWMKTRGAGMRGSMRGMGQGQFGIEGCPNFQVNP